MALKYLHAHITALGDRQEVNSKKYKYSGNEKGFMLRITSIVKICQKKYFNITYLEWNDSLNILFDLIYYLHLMVQI